MTRRTLCLLWMVLATAGAAPAGGAAPESVEELPLGRVAAASPGAPDASPGVWIARTLGALALVIVLIIALRLLLVRGTRGEAGDQRLLEVLARVPIAPRTRVLFLRVNDRVIIAAQSPHGVHPLDVIDTPEGVDWVLAHASPRGFGRLLDRHSSPGDSAETARQRLDSMADRIRAAREKGGGL